MRRHATVVVLAAVLVSGCGTGPARPTSVGPTSTDNEPVSESDLLRQVSSGGYVLFFRHAERDTNAMGTAELAVADNAGACMPGSELTSKGVQDSIAIGAGFVRRGILVDKVYASPTCRTTQMAALAFRTFETTRALTWPDMWDDEEASSLTPLLRGLLATRPSAGRNTVLISHGNVLLAGRIGVDIPLEQSEACVFRPLGGDAFEVVGRIAPQRWTE